MTSSTPITPPIPKLVIRPPTTSQRSVARVEPITRARHGAPAPTRLVRCESEVLRVEQPHVRQPRLFDRLTGAGIAVDDRRDADDVPTRGPGCFYGLEDGAAGRGGIFQDHHVPAGDVGTLHLPAHAVPLRFLAHEEGIER